MINYKVVLPTLESVADKSGVNPGGFAQKFFANEIVKLSDPYVPFKQGVLKNTVVISPDATYIEYVAPYARYHWYGKLMVDPITKKGAFFSPDYGFWSRKGVPKELTDRDMSYIGAPQRGPKWVERMWQSDGKQICASVERLINDGRK